MSEHLVLVSHGRFCEELKKSAEMIIGPQETISTVTLLPEEGEADFLEKF
ncbi:PTS fructose transporter subunit IIA, partial [Enterococcus faecalis]|nr:PTS fructose transporter subunit IIA [Enterococcus faecalis]